MTVSYEVAFKRGSLGTAGEQGAGSGGEKSAIFECNLVSAEGIARYPVVVREAHSRGMLPLLRVVVASSNCCLGRG